MSNYTVTIDCNTGNGYDGRIGVRISSIFVIGFGSLLGALLPIAAARTKKMRVPPVAFFITKYFGSGVIIATAFIHLLSPANQALNSPCLTGTWSDYDWAQGIALMTIFVMFFIEIMASRFDVFGEEHSHDLEALDPLKELARQNEKHDERKPSVHKDPSPEPGLTNSTHTNGASSSSERVDSQTDLTNAAPQSNRSESDAGQELVSKHRKSVPGREDDFSYPPGGEDHLGHLRDHDIDHDHFAAQMTAIFILEFGVIFHSIFIGLTLAVTGDNFTVLYIVLAFHQTFEGLGLGSRLATAQWPKKKLWMPWVLGTAYGLATPIAIGIGLGVKQSFTPGSNTTMIVNGIFDSISAGILIYTGLVELMAHEFMFNPEMRKSSIKMMMFAFLCMCIGAGVMALLGRWA